MANIQEFWQEVRRIEADLRQKHGGEVFVTSILNRDKNTSAGHTCSASPYLAAMGIVSQTHQLSTPEQIAAFKELQEKNLRTTQMEEQRKHKQYVVVVNQDQGAGYLPQPPAAAPALKQASK